MTIEIQCTSCHTRYRIDEQVLPEGTPTFKCSRCGHVFSFEPRAKDLAGEDSPDQEEAGRDAGAEETSPRMRSGPQRLATLKTDLPAGGGETRNAVDAVAEAEAGAKSASFRAWQAAHNQPEEEDAAVLKPPADVPRGQTGAAETGKAMPRRAGREGISPRENDSIHQDDPLARPFGHAAEESEPGENLAFDFNDDQSEPSESGEPDEHLVANETAKWQVGNSDDAFGADRDRAAEGPREMRGDESSADASRPRTRRSRKRPLDDEFVDERAAPLYNRAVTHSSRLFLGLLLAFVAAYGLLTLIIRGAPVAASEMLSRVPMIGERFVPQVTPASLVALRNVNSNYQQVKGGHSALVITGEAENVAGSPLHVVQVEVNLRDSAQRTIASHAVYCGNNLAHKMVGEMTPHEIEFFQRLDPPKSFTLESADKCPFMLVFIDPPAGVTRFDILVAKAVPVAAEAAASNNF